MIFDSQAALKQRIEELTPRRVHGRVKVFEDTSSYMSIHGGSVLRLAGNDYFVMGDTKEGRFGIDDQPKFWVKYAYDLTTGQRKIIKLVFYEDFSYRKGVFLIKAQRSPEKEAHCLEVTKDDPRFMHGVAVRDSAGNLVRVIDHIEGKSLFAEVGNIRMDHEEYFRELYPQLMQKVVGAIEALRFLQNHGEHHGDVRNDHILIEKDTKDFRWIDFDYQVSYDDYDIWSAGNILTYVTAKRIISFQEVAKRPEHFPLMKKTSLTADDALLFYKYRIANLQKIYPYIPDKLNRVLMSFSQGTYLFYEHYNDLISDLKEALEEL